MSDAAVALGPLGDFEVIGLLGSGGSGVVLDARWGHREVALKVLHPTLVATPRERQQFLEEARRLQDITHPGVVKVLASGELPDGRPYLAMEKLEGPTLAARLAAGPLPLAQALPLFDQLASAVQALHDRGLVHRDLKPENIVLVAGAHAVLLDFGIAKALAAPASTTTQDGGVRGTPAYMAPERFFGQPASVTTDVYELGVTLYAMLAGTLPWADCGDPEVRLNPTSLGDRVPEAVDIEIRRALSTRAQNRPASARELATAVFAAAGVTSTPGARTTTQVALDVGARDRAWFQTPSGSGGENKGTTPLAWAPTARLERRAEVARARRPWWPIAATAVAAVAAGVGWLVLRGDDPAPPRAAVSAATPAVAAPRTPAPASAPDPWAGAAGSRSAAGAASPNALGGEAPPSAAPEPADRVVAAAPARPVADLRREMNQAIGMLPANTRTVVGLAVAELRSDASLGQILSAVAARPEVKLVIGADDACPLGLADVDWVVMGFSTPGIDREGEVLLRGRWTRQGLEACLAAISGGPAVVDPATGLTHFDGKRNHFWLGLAGEVALVSTRDRVEPAALVPLLSRTAGPEGRAGELFRHVDRDATMVLLVDQDDDDAIDAMPTFPRGMDLVGWARVEGGLRGVITGAFRTAADAKRSESYVATKLAEATRDGGSMMGSFTTSRRGKEVGIDAWVTPLTLGIAATQFLTP